MNSVAWRVGSSLVTRRCGDSARMRAAWPWAPLRHGALWVSTWMELAAGWGRMDDNGAAVLCLEPPQLRQALRMVVVMAGVMVAGGLAGGIIAVIWPPLVVAIVVGLALVCARARWFSWRCRGVNRQLRQARPAGGWNIHNFAGDPDRRGAGRALLDAVCDEADRRRRVLYLDTVVPRLVEYYGECGFEPTAQVAAQFAGEDLVITRMVRQPIVCG